MLFEFILRPLEDVQPWGEDEPTLHWFGLTDGWCWWNVGSQQLFRYSQATIEYWAREYPQLASDPPYVDYQVVRPWEDLVDFLRTVLEPVPDDLITRTQDLKAWNSFREEAWSRAGRQDTDQSWDLQTTAFNWWSERTWDAGYLSHPPRIWAWAQSDIFHIRWNNQDNIDDGLPVWQATHGEMTMPVAEFVEEARSFNNRLMSQMAQRVNAVVAGTLRSDIKIDLAHLVYEQSDRSTWLENALTLGQIKEDWDKVRAALTTLERICYNNGVEGL